MIYSELEKFREEIEKFAEISRIRAIDKDTFEFEIYCYRECDKLLVCMDTYFIIGSLEVKYWNGSASGEEEKIDGLSIKFKCEVRAFYN